jgi:hypothetical protein
MVNNVVTGTAAVKRIKEMRVKDKTNKKYSRGYCQKAKLGFHQDINMRT